MQLWNDAEALRLVLQPKLLFSSHLLWGHSRSLSRDVPFSLLEVYSFPNQLYYTFTVFLKNLILG
jgi:hypothetical protein